MSPPSTCQTMLPRPPGITATNATQDQNSTADSELPVSDTEAESSYTLQTENTNFSLLQDHIVHLPRPPCNPRPTKQHQRPCFNKNQQHKDNNNTPEDEITSAPPKTCPVPPPRPSKATNIKQTSANQ